MQEKTPYKPGFPINLNSIVIGSDVPVTHIGRNAYSHNGGTKLITLFCNNNTPR